MSSELRIEWKERSAWRVAIVSFSVLRGTLNVCSLNDVWEVATEERGEVEVESEVEVDSEVVEGERVADNDGT